MAGDLDFDYIVVGAGAAGCALAGELAEALPAATIGLIEPGPRVADGASVWEPWRWPEQLGGPLDWRYWSQPQTGLSQRRLLYSRGRGLGGSGLLNAMLWSRGFESDWVATGWPPEQVGRLFDKIEQRLGLETIRLGQFGDAVAAAAEACGLAAGPGDGVWAGPGLTRQYRATIANGRRADLFGLLGADRPNVRLVRGKAERLALDGGAAVGVWLEGGRLVRAAREVAVCCGAIDSPKLLQLSGIGPAELLAAHGVPLVLELPVGERLVDHPLLPCVMLQMGWPPPGRSLSPNSVQGWLYHEHTRIDFVDGQSAGWIAGWGLTNPLNRPGRLWAALWLVASGLAWLLTAMLRLCPGLAGLFTGVVALNLSLAAPTSRGSVRISSADPADPPLVDPNILGSPADQAAIRRGLGTVRAIAARLPGVVCLLPGPLTDQQHWRANCATYFHPTGSCSIGHCLDSELRVRGIQQLRVCDGSALPVHPRAPTAASCMLVGARAAQMMAAAHPNGAR